MRGNLDDKNRLQHIFDAIVELESFVDGVALPNFEANRMMQQACVSNLMIIGEATNHLSATTKDKYNWVDWSGIKGFRNVIVHEYFKINTTLVWQLIHNNLPELKQVVAQALKNLEEGN